MTVWDWVDQFEAEALARGDAERLRLAHIHPEAYEHRQTDPDRMLALLAEGRRLARVLDEPWWVLFFDHWRVEALIYYKDDYREVVEMAVRLMLDLRKPVFEAHPLRFGIYCNLVAAYLCVDPRGHAEAVRDALGYLQTEVPTEGGDRYLLQARRHWFAYELGELERAQQLALEELVMCDADPDRYLAAHHEVDTYKALSRIAFKRQDWPALRMYAGMGEERARGLRYRYELALFLVWQGLVARWGGHEDEAKRFVRRGTREMGRLGQPPDDSYFDGLCAYHEVGGELEEAWRLRERHLAETVGRGQLATEVECRIKRCRLLARLGRPWREEEAAAREAIERLRVPGWYREELAKVGG